MTDHLVAMASIEILRIGLPVDSISSWCWSREELRFSLA
ncbi:hypothetical protein AWB69_03080 [Caballeronia udeis]|uniref:Uncharacterized protein n=1 Tax=Caballeronia udeis TaxID=1232866 RepID=A0A158GPD6_9BURK|nr:hypothetical protein AWB69_03080 [Caballeronia udeis]